MGEWRSGAVSRRTVVRLSAVVRAGIRLPTLFALACAAVVSPGGAHADPGVDPFPDIRYYDRADPTAYVEPAGVWFTAPTGQNCGIWGLGSFGCRGAIPGAPDGTAAIGWVDGDRAVHYDWSMAVRFPATQAHRPLPPRTSVTHQGSTCAATPDGRTYCERGPLRFVIEPTKTWLSGPWMDMRWVELGPASCSPPGGGPCYR